MWTKRTREPELCEPELCEPKIDNFNEKKYKIVHKILVHIILVHAYFLTLYSNKMITKYVKFIMFNMSSIILIFFIHKLTVNTYMEREKKKIEQTKNGFN